ncbi:MAG TPA: lmo0937 family membrane protein [Candidatus Angelobacter sp.]|nr:lmo0937 family membrane protein [Candidatus Angelobacter sp.]
MFFILLLMWALGMISSYTFGGAIHLLLVFALIALVIRLAQGRSVGLIDVSCVFRRLRA